MTLKDFAEYVVERIGEKRPFVSYWHTCGYGMFYLDGGPRAEQRFRKCLRDMGKDTRVKDLRVVEVDGRGWYYVTEDEKEELTAMIKGLKA